MHAYSPSAPRHTSVLLAALALAALCVVSLTPGSADAAFRDVNGDLTLGLTTATSSALGTEMAIENRFDAAALSEGGVQVDVDVATLAQAGGVALLPEPKPVAAAAPTPAVKKATTKTVASSVPVITVDSESQWSTAHLDSVCRAALAAYGVPQAEWDWVLAANRNVAYRESRNRPGARSASGSFAGMHQWGAAWGALDQRINGEWSVYRFVKVYADGGKTKIRQHWAQSVGL